jgi:hypothetical protein
MAFYGGLHIRVSVCLSYSVTTFVPNIFRPDEKRLTLKMRSEVHVGVYLKQGCTNLWRHIAVVTKFCTVVPDICRCSVWNQPIHVTLLAPIILS